MMRPAETAVYQTRSTTSAQLAGMFEKVGVRHSSVRPKAPARLPLAMTSALVTSYNSQLAVAPASFEDQENVSLRAVAALPGTQVRIVTSVWVVLGVTPTSAAAFGTSG